MSVHRVAILAIDGVYPINLGIPTQVFNPRPDTNYELTVCGAGRGPVRTSSGFTLGGTSGLSAVDHADTIVVPGYENYPQPPDSRILAALNRAARRGARMVSIGSGAFALAYAGLLDGRTVTTHWTRASELEALFPQVRVDRNVLYVDDRDILTSAGLSAGIDLCLHVVRKDLGAAVANGIAREIVAAPHRNGGQAQYVDLPVPNQDLTTLTATRNWALTRLSEDLTVEVLAEHASVSTRTLARMWQAETGTTPHQWLLSARINDARELLETTDLNVEQIAARSGLGSSTSLRARFHAAVGTTPTAYRRTFRQEIAS